MGSDVGLSWVQAGGAAVVALIVIGGPGWVVARAFGYTQLDRLGLAAPLGVAVLLGAGLVVDLAGIPWTRTSSAVGLLTTVICLSLLARRFGCPAPASQSTSWLGVVVGLCIAGVGTIWKVVGGIPAPESLSHEPDAQFHLLAITHLLDVQSASPIRSGEVHFYASSFYPGGFHSIAATVASWAGVDAVAAAHVVLVLCAAVVWPLGAIALVARTVSPSGWVLTAAGALALTAVLGPISMLSIGAPWANMMSAAMVPGALIPLGALASQTEVPTARQSLAAAIPLMFAAAGATLAQPNGAYSIALLSAAMLAPVARSWGRRWMVTYLLGLAALVVCWVIPVNPLMLDLPVSVDESNRRAVLVLLKNGDVPLWSGGVVAALTLAGVAIGLRRGGLAAGLALMWLVTAAFGLALQLGDVMPVARLTWPWFSGYPRIATMVSLAVVLVASLPVAWLMDRMTSRSARLGVFVGSAIVVGTTALALPAAAAGERILDASYDPASRRGFVSPEDAKDLEDLASRLEAGDTVAVDPARGGVFMGLYGPRVVPVGPFYAWTPEIDLVATELYRAGSDEAVCDAVRELGVDFALVGGDRADTFTEIPEYPGIDRVPAGDRFREVASVGRYRLFEVPRSCTAVTSPG